ncbi:MAG: hypothetical protein D3923_17335, partial [Candidatus Electrothrix sp. AR3]|nr:hypothetical protein [Candidatus Electrothrix sp. AR3]
TCTLADAITSANNDTATGGCAQGAGSDRIILATDLLLEKASPSIISTMTIEGKGHTIDGNKLGSVLSVEDGRLMLNEATLTGGDAAAGGGIYNYGGTVTLNSSTVSGNQAESSGGIYNFAGTVTLNNSTVSNNQASSAGSTGGGIGNYSGVLLLNTSTISGNTASTTGGGIENSSDYSSSVVTLKNSTVSGNEAETGGGIDNISYSYPAIITLVNSTVSGNIAEKNGGGITNYVSSYWGGNSTVTLTNSTVTGNTAVRGGGIYNYFLFNDSSGSPTVTLVSSVISGNIATAEGHEIYNSIDSNVNADNNNLFGHSDATDAQAFLGFAPGENDVRATSDGGNPVALSAILNTTLADNGGPTMTHALVEGSPAIDQDPSCDVSRDQRKYGRPVGVGCDAGSFEFNGEPIPEKDARPWLYQLLL